MQTHCPPVHTCPEAQAPQLAPPVPHDDPDWFAYPLHVPLVPPLQQPVGQVSASHVQRPVVVSQRLLAHGAQVAPPAPHCEEDSDPYATHALPLQQPLGHEVASQTHWPALAPVLLHSCPEAHGPQAAPPVPQVALDSAE